jgi:CRISPR-associated protein Csm5
MVWKDQVNVLDQQRIFRLLAKGPRLDGYLAQLKKADKLDFASWGGFAQNFADRRIPFEHASGAVNWTKVSGDALFIPTFASGPAGPYLPASAIKGALRTGMMFANTKPGMLPAVLERLKGPRAPRRVGDDPEEQALGQAGVSRMRAIGAGDSAPVARDGFRVYQLRVSTLQAKGPGAYSLGWKQTSFAEMAPPGAVFEGDWREPEFFRNPEIRRSLRWPEKLDRAAIFAAANEHSSRILELHRRYAEWTGLDSLAASIADLELRKSAAQSSGDACLLSIGWGAGLMSKSAWPDSENEDVRAVLKSFPFYSRPLNTKLPFPKTRRIVFLADKPATLPGWVLLEVHHKPGMG